MYRLCIYYSIRIFITRKKLTFKHLYIPTITLLFLPVIWLALRWQYDGFNFVIRMVEYDLLHRSGSQIEGHISTPLFYLEQLKDRFPMPAVMLLVLLPISIKTIGFKSTFSYDFVIIFSTMIITYVFYSAAQTRLYWYSYLSVILLCLSAAILAYKCGKIILMVSALMCVLTMIYFSNEYYKNIKYSSLPDFYYQLKHISSMNEKKLVVEGRITQSERMSIMFMTNFDFRNIHVSPVTGGYILMTKNHSNSQRDGCSLVSKGKTFTFYKCI